MSKSESKKEEYHDLPFVECVELAEDLVKRGFMLFQKFTCEECGQRLGMTVPNAFYTEGSCDRCGHITKITKCGFLLLAVAPL